MDDRTDALEALRQPLIEALRAALPELLSIYAFGSLVSGQSGPESDHDLAVLVPGKVDPLRLFELASELAGIAKRSVDLLDFRAASTVMQHQILTTGQRWWARDARAGLYECAVLSQKTALDEARAGLLADIAATAHRRSRDHEAPRRIPPLCSRHSLGRCEDLTQRRRRFAGKMESRTRRVRTSGGLGT